MANKAVVTQTTLDAIGQAIIAKGGATAPMTPAQMPAAIASIPTGEIIERPVYDPVEAVKGTAIEIHIEDNDLSFGFIGIIRDSGSSSYVIDWGDDSAPQTFTDSSSIFNKNQVSHSYSSAGNYIINVSDNCSRIVLGVYASEQSADETLQWRQKQKIKIRSVKRIGTKITSAEEMFRGCTNLRYFERWFPPTCSNMRACFADCYSLKNFGEWPTSANTVTECYRSCYSLTGSIPEWGAGITNVTQCYYMCFNLTGSIPEWGAGITNAYQCYYMCFNLTGSIPEWGAGITNAYQCYFRCYNLSGNIPRWGQSLENVYEVYSDCTNLSGVWSETTTDEELMPLSITTHGSAVGRCGASLRSYFKTDWGGTRSV